MSFSVQFKAIGLPKLLKELSKNLPEDAQKRMHDALAEAAMMVHSTAVKSIQAHESIGERYGNHFASKPGFPPNSDTGVLAKSIQFVVEKDRALVGTNLRRGAWMEFGTENVAPRPWLFPALMKNVKDIQRVFEKAAKKILKDGAS
jgi:phage gpG-like protein